jgi:glycine/D-amino acid oxidase-like deaminating enzyme
VAHPSDGEILWPDSHSGVNSSSSVKTVVIIGGGIIGMSTALWLLRHGHKVTVVDPRAPGHGASCGNAATIANYHCIPLGSPSVIRQIPGLLFNRDSPLTIRWSYLPKLAPWLARFLLASRPERVAAIAKALAALQQHADAAYRPLLEMAGGEDLVIRRGCLYLYGSAASYARARPEIDLRRRHGVALEELGAKRIAELEPHLAPIYHRGILFPGASHLRDPLELVERFARTFLQRGGTLIQEEAKAIESDGKEGILIRGTGTSLAGDYVVVAAGAWSRPLARQVGDHVPLDTERGYHVMFPGAQALLSRPVGWAEMGFYMTPLASGLRAAGTVEFAGLQAPANPERTRFLVRGARGLLPQLGEPASEWLGFRPSLPDSLPIIGPSPRNPRVIYAFGHGHLGVTLAGVTGRMVSDLIDDRRSVVDPTPYRPERFR